MSTSIFTDPIEVYNKVVKMFIGEPINKDDVFEWCIDAETNYIQDGDLLAKFEKAPVTIDSTTNLGYLPCNIIRIIEVYDGSENDVEYQLTASNHIKINGTHDTVYINYLGLYVDENGVPRIRSGHVNALTTFCAMKIIEPKVLMLKMPIGMLDRYEQKFSNQVIAVKQSAQYKDKLHYDRVNIIRFNMLKKVGQQRLFKNIFG